MSAEVAVFRSVGLDPLRTVAYGWWWAHALRGSVVVRTFRGPFALRRAIAWQVRDV